MLRRRLRGAPLAAAVVMTAGCSFFSRKPAETPAQAAARQTDDVRIQREVEARLAAEPSIGAGRVRASVDAGVVSLFGGVSGLGALRCAERNAELVRGVRNIVDQIVLDPGPVTVQCLSPRAAPATGSPAQ